MNGENSILVSIIIPICNSEKYLRDCLDSLISQSLQEIEILCIENGSEDNSEKIIDEYSSRDGRIKKIICPKSNAGKARNYGLQKAQGDYVAFLDADDFAKQDMLETSYQAALKNNSDVTVFEFDLYDDASKKKITQKLGIQNIEKFPIDKGFSPASVKDDLFSFSNCPWNKLFKRSFINNNKISFQEIARANDVYFSYISLALAKKICIVDKALVYYRINNKDSLQSTKDMTPLAFLQAYTATKNSLEKYDLYKKFKNSFLREYVHNVVYSVNTAKSFFVAKKIQDAVKKAEKNCFFVLDEDEKVFLNTEEYKSYKRIIYGNTKDMVCAVVVTHDREELLLQCLSAIYSQSRVPDTVIVVDNNSSVDLENTLKNSGYYNKDNFYYKKLSKNIGGAGGFFEGVKFANQKNCDWIWLLDDDAIPEKDCLFELLNANVPKNTSFLASNVKNIYGEPMNVPSICMECSNSKYLSWPDRLEDGIIKINDATFVSILVKNEAVDTVGYPVKDYFIWGDDTEYTMRLISNFGPAFMIGKSIVTHKRANPRAISIIDENDKNRIPLYYYLYRNSAINIRTYFGKKQVLKFFRDNFRKKITIIKGKNISDKILKIKTITKGELDYVFRKYDLQAFLNRFDKNVKYKGDK